MQPRRCLASSRGARRPWRTLTCRRSCCATRASSWRELAAQFGASPVLFMQSNGGLVDAGGLARRQRRALRPRRRRRGHDRGWFRRRSATLDRLRHGRHVHRRQHVQRRDSAALRSRDRWRAPAGSAGGHPDDRGRRRLDPASSRMAGSRWARSRPAQIPGPACYRRDGPADCHRLQRRARSHSAGALSAGVRPRRRRNDRRRRSAERPAGAGGIARACQSGAPYTVESHRRRIRQRRCRAHGQCHPRARAAPRPGRRPATRWCALVARRDSTPAPSRRRSASTKCCCIRWPASCRRMASGSRVAAPSGARPSNGTLDDDGYAAAAVTLDVRERRGAQRPAATGRRRCDASKFGRRAHVRLAGSDTPIELPWQDLAALAPLLPRRITGSMASRRRRSRARRRQRHGGSRRDRGRAGSQRRLAQAVDARRRRSSAARRRVSGIDGAWQDVPLLDAGRICAPA